MPQERSVCVPRPVQTMMANASEQIEPAKSRIHMAVAHVTVKLR